MKTSSTAIIAAARECFRTGKKPYLFRWERSDQPMWCLWWGGENVQVIVKFEYAVPVLKSLWQNLGH